MENGETSRSRGPTEVGRKLKLAPQRIKPRAIEEQAEPLRVMGEEHTNQISSAARGASFSLRRALARLPHPAQRPAWAD